MSKLLTTSAGRSDTTISLVFFLNKPWSAMTAQERCDALAIMAAEFTQYAAQAQEERLEIAEQELAA
ncbi:MAG: hypothetical protein KDE23_15005 [Caldilinea sp.]|nr:hypothetical protein [Caldilinea sp.]